MKPKREPARNNQQTYFISFQTAERLPLFRHERWLLLFLNIVSRHASEFVLHDYVVMEDHVHLLLTPEGPLERTVQLLKGGFSFQAKREFQWNAEIWQRGFTDHRVRDAQDFEQHLSYIRRNLDSLRKSLQEHHGRAGASTHLVLAPIPPRLKPQLSDYIAGPAEAGPLQNPAGEPPRQNSF